MELHNKGSSNGSTSNGSLSPTVNGIAIPSHGESSMNGQLNNKNDDCDVLRDNIAICGMAMRLPGGIRHAEAFWDLLKNGQDARGPIPATRYNAAGFNDLLGNKGAIKTQYGYFLDEDLASLDTSFFTLSKTELERCDPQQRQLLEVTRECLENAGEVGYRGKLIGCYVGTFGEDWLQMSAKESQHSGGYIMTGHGDLMIANRVSYEYDFKGPSMVIKTGCSASLVGLHEACRALQMGDCTAAIVAGTNLILGPTTTAAMTQEGILSPEGSCKTFDATADGFARGEAITAVYVKRLDDAIRDKSPVRAVIRATSINSDGKSQGLMTPNGMAHEALMRKVYLDAGLNPRDTAFVECHGTGTPTGDPIETTAVGNVFGERGVFIGSVKPNIGHSEGSSGISSLIKAVLALEHKTIPPNIKFNKPNPKIPFEKKQLKVPVEALPWPKDRHERISINSFGIGGTNAHVILESFTGISSAYTNGFVEKLEAAPQLLLFAANSQISLQTHINNIESYLQIHPKSISDVAYTLALRREKLPFRGFSIASNSHITRGPPGTKVPGTMPEITMIFSGQGAQWPEMCADLITSDVVFRGDIQAMDKILQSLRFPPQWSIADELQKKAETSQIHRAELSQPLCTAMQIAIINFFRRYGIEPKAVIGHSSGEIAAAYAAGVLSLTEAMITAYYRGYVTKAQKMAGAMAAVGLGSEAVSSFLKKGVVVACENSPSNTTISGQRDAVEEVIANIKKKKPDVLTRLLKVDMAYHSHHMEPLGKAYLHLVQEELKGRKLTRKSPKVPFFSSVTREVVRDPASLGPLYWQSNLTSPVLFGPAVTALLAHQRNNLFLEIGPHSTLAGPLRQICATSNSACLYVPAMLRDKPCSASLLSAIGLLDQHGISMDLTPLYPNARVLTDLPTYPWNHSATYWYEPRLSKDWRFRNHGHHGLLGLRIHETPSTTPSWRNVLHLEDESWLVDHKIRQDVVFPFAGYIAMVGEAVRQITGAEIGYRVRHVVAHTALLLSDSKPVEIFTSLRPRRITDAAESEEFEFTISSYTGSRWIKNCDGRVLALAKSVNKSSRNQDHKLCRKVITPRWYETMAKIGIVYGPEFRSLDHITSSTSECVAAGQIVNPPSHQNAPFLFHPAAIDACLQLLLVALAKGLGRNFMQLSVPTTIEELDIYQSVPNMDATAWCLEGKRNIGVECVAGGKVALRLSGIQLTALDDERVLESLDLHAAARLRWRPDFDFMNMASLFKPPVSNKKETELQEEMTLLCILDSAERLRGLETQQPHFLKFRDWLQREINRALSGSYPLVKDAAKYVDLSRDIRRQMIEERFTWLVALSKKAVAIGIKRICDNAAGLFTGTADTLDILMRDDILTEIYNAVSFDHSDFVRQLSNTKPNLRILEVGAGTGGTTELILRDLVDEGGFPAYSTYTFTDVSAGFFHQAKERFAYAPNMDYKVFDISQNPFEQGFEASTFDVIFAPNVVHATPCLQQTLRNLQPLLRPHGHLVLTELCAVVRTPNFIFGNFSGWWLGEADGRPDEPYISVARWDTELKAAGFTGVHTAVYDEEEPYQYCAAIVSQPQLIEDNPPGPQAVTVLCGEPLQGTSKCLIEHLRSSGMDVTTCGLGELPNKDQDIISTLDLETYFFENISQDAFSAFQNLIRHHTSRNFLWLTKPTQINCQDPRSAQTIGLARTLRSELAIPFYTLEIDAQEHKFPEFVMQVLHKIRNLEDADSLASDKEFAVDEGFIKIGRYHPLSLSKELAAKSVESAPAGVKTTLEITRPGLMDTLNWNLEAARENLCDGEIEMQIKAFGLNFRDIVLAMGIISSGADTVPLGLEASGIIRRVGPNVKELAPGDRVYALAPHGCMTTSLILPAPLCIKIPDEMSYEEATTIPICFATAIRGLLDVGQVERGQTVLIHSASGGVGHAAIQICRMVGAELYVTVGSEKKVQYIMDTFEIPRDHIFSSRDDSFVSGLMHKTGGRGVDIVLNSLSGELLHASWKCVAEFGKLVELGKRDLAACGQLDMQPFLANRSYCCVDIAQFIRDKPETMGRMLERCLDLYRQKKIRPIQPASVFDSCEVDKGFRLLQGGDHIGKVVVKMPEDTSQIKARPRAHPTSFDPQASYILTGGLGGLGKAIATWLADRGARDLVFLSRSAGLTDDSKEFFAELESMGCHVSAIAGKAQRMADVEAAISKATGPVKGLFHMAMVLQDAPILDMTHADWIAASQPKVDGTWNLHKALSRYHLDFFFLASSLVTVVDQPGQGNYNAANTFLEAFCQYRHSLGLPASVLNICPIDGVGFVAENPTARRNMKAQGLYFLGEEEFLDFVELSVLNSAPIASSRSSRTSSTVPSPWTSTGQLLMGLRSELHLDDPNNRTNWRQDRRMGTYHNVRDMDKTGDASTSSLSSLKSFLSRATEEPDLLKTEDSQEYLAHQIGRKVYDFMLKSDEEVDIALSLAQLGLDSLMAVELRRWWKQALGLQISQLEIMATGSLMGLGKIAAEGLQGKIMGTS